MRREQALAIYLAGRAAVVDALCELSAKVTSLEHELAKRSKDSSTSSKPPSSDIVKPARRQPNDDPDRKGAKKRKIGGQPGHPKHQRAPFSEEHINDFWDYHLHACPGCGDHHLVPLHQPPKVTQQIELKEVVTHLEEHRAYPYWCNGCQCTHYASLPDAVVREGLFKARLTALVAYMSRVCHASFSTIRKYLRDILGVRVSRGYLAKLIQKVSRCLQLPYQELLERLPLETALNVDETGHKDNGNRFWTWVFKADLYVLFRIDKSRGSNVLIDVLGEQFDGVLGCDYFSAYRKFMRDFNVTVQFCIAHLIRDIKYLCKLPDPLTKLYGETLLQAVAEMFKLIHARENMTPAAFNEALNDAKDAILDIGANQAPSALDDNGKEIHNQAQNIANRFRLHGKQYFQFITTPQIDPTNNLAEQAIRFIVIDRHISQGTRSPNGRTANERLWTVIATCSLQGRSAFDFILQALNAYFHDQPLPSLVPT